MNEIAIRVVIYEYTFIADIFQFFYIGEILMFLLRKLLPIYNSLGNMFNYRKNQWAIELRHITNDQEIRSYTLSFEINKSSSYRIK